MNFAAMDLSDIIGTFVGLVLTLAVFSYLLGDNILFRIAIYIFVGVAAGLAAAMVAYNVLVNDIYSLWFGRCGGQTERLVIDRAVLLILPQPQSLSSF
jgi:predicted membrane protein